MAIVDVMPVQIRTGAAVAAQGLSFVLSVFALIFLTVIFYRTYLHPLSRVPGPRLAAVSSCWYAYQVRNGRMLEMGKKLHRIYGSMVRVGPNEVWLCSKEAFREIYNPTGGYEKSDFYLATALLKPKLDSRFHIEDPDTLDLLAERDMKRYRLQRRLIGPIYKTNNVKRYEAAVDAVLERVVDQLHSLGGAQVDLKMWMHIIVVECLGAVSLSWSPGYLKAKHDGGSGKHAYLGWRRKSVFGLFPTAVIAETLSASFGRAFSVLWGITYSTPKGFKPFFPAVQKKITQRIKAGLQAKPQGKKSQPQPEYKDLISDLIQLHKDRSEFTEIYLRRMAITNFGAGHETLTSTLISAITLIGSHPEVQKRIIEELQIAKESADNESSVGLRYTQACVKEAQRLHPVIGMSLPRKVPAGGLYVHGFYFPPGTTVGCNPVSLHRSPEIFGDDADRFNPDRWLRDDTRDMDRYNLIWGGGARTCPGRYLAEMLLAKIVPTLVEEFKLDITMPPEHLISYYFMAMLTHVKVRFLRKAE